MGQEIEGYFEDFSEGMSFVTTGRTITETDIVNFAGISGDFNPVHMNAAYAATTPFEQRIAHGLLGLSVASGLTTGLGFMGDKVEAFMGLEWKFRAPIFIGDTIHSKLTVSKLRRMARLGGGLVNLKVEVIKQDGTTVQRGVWKVLFKSRPAPQESANESE
ncbi:MAG: MaoC/PaaZ C-terminal domain-containing protein [Ardenticatenaceae bacterium]